MGYFTNLYVVDINEKDAHKIVVRTEVYGGGYDRAYFAGALASDHPICIDTRTEQ
jgi:hypothetical protein